MRKSGKTIGKKRIKKGDQDMNRINRFMPLVLIIIATMIFISATYVEETDRSFRIVIGILANSFLTIAVLLIIRGRFEK